MFSKTVMMLEPKPLSVSIRAAPAGLEASSLRQMIFAPG